MLALYDSTEPVANRPGVNFTHLLLEMPLNRLGFAVDYHDVNVRPLPDASGYRGIVIWFTDNAMAQPVGYLTWLRGALRTGVRAVVVEGLGADVNLENLSTPPMLVQSTYEALGLKRDVAMPPSANPFVVRYRDVTPKHFRFETTMPPTESAYQRFVKDADDLAVWRTVERTDVPNSLGVAVAVGPRGGFILQSGVALRERDADGYRAHWDLDPFAFLEAALDCAGTPRPDVTTAFGARAAFSHIDADGYANMAQDVPGPPRLCSRVVLDEVLKQYPVPVTVGFIVGHIDPAALGSEAKLQLAREIAAEPNVQVGCHGYAHPLDWEKQTVGLKYPGYTYSLKMEIEEAVRFINDRVLGGASRTRLYQWTGDCKPPAEAMALCAELGLLNLNGGSTRYDEAFNSIAFIEPLARTVGGYRQPNAPARNEYEFTARWTRNFGGFRQVLETFKRTASPRLLPVNVYHHFYSGERLAALRSLQAVHEWCLKQPLCWIHAAEYAEAVLDFHRASMARTGDGGWTVRDFGACRTVRFDATDAHVDMARSDGVLGYTHHANALYVALAEADCATLYLSDKAPDALCLKRSTSALKDLTAERTRWSAGARLYAPGFIELRGAPPNAAGTAEVGRRRQAVRADDAGVLRVALPGGRGAWAPVSVALDDTAAPR